MIYHAFDVAQGVQVVLAMTVLDVAHEVSYSVHTSTLGTAVEIVIGLATV
jgi:hypothetical protein